MPVGFDALLHLVNLGQALAKKDEQNRARWTAETTDENFPRGLPYPGDIGGSGPIGSLARYRVPMRVIQRPGYGSWGETPNKFTYYFRNRLGEPKFRAKIDSTLQPEYDTAHIDFLRAEAGEKLNRGEVRPGATRRIGINPERLKDIVGRYVEEVSGAGYPKVESEPTTVGRFRLYDRIMRKLKSEGKIPSAEKLSYSQAKPRMELDEEGPALRAIMRRREMERFQQAGSRGSSNQADLDYIFEPLNRPNQPIVEQMGQGRNYSFAELDAAERALTPAELDRLTTLRLASGGSMGEQFERHIAMESLINLGRSRVRAAQGIPSTSDVWRDVAPDDPIRSLSAILPENMDIYRLTPPEALEYQDLVRRTFTGPRTPEQLQRLNTLEDMMTTRSGSLPAPPSGALMDAIESTLSPEELRELQRLRDAPTGPLQQELARFRGINALTELGNRRLRERQTYPNLGGRFSDDIMDRLRAIDPEDLPEHEQQWLNMQNAIIGPTQPGPREAAAARLRRETQPLIDAMDVNLSNEPRMPDLGALENEIEQTLRTIPQQVPRSTRVRDALHRGMTGAWDRQAELANQGRLRETGTYYSPQAERVMMNFERETPRSVQRSPQWEEIYNRMRERIQGSD